MDLFKDEYVYLNVKGYTLFHQELVCVSSSPLFSWRKKTRNKRLHWECQHTENPNQSFWLTELCLVKGHSYVKHFVPGVYLKTMKNTISEKTFRYVWKNIQDKYTFLEDEIIDQCQVRDYLNEIITPDTVLFYKGGQLERMIAELCGAQDAVNIEDLGTSGKAVIPKPLVTGITCKVHTRQFNHCPLQKSCYYMNKIAAWLPNYTLAE